MSPAVLLASLIAGGAVAGAPDEPQRQPIRQDTVWAEGVKRGIEEPGRYAAANLFDGDAATSYCSAPGDGLGRVSVGLSDADAALLPKLTGVRVTPSPATPARRFEAWFYYPAAGGFGGGRAEGAVGSTSGTLAIEKRDLGPSGAAITIYLRGDDPRHDRGPFCLAEIAFLGPAGPVELPDLSRAVKTAMKRDAELARLTADRAAFARAYMTSFHWELRNRHKETSDWESASYLFFPDGSYQEETYHLTGLDPDVPERVKGPWSIGKNGKTVLMDGSPSRLLPCRTHRGYLCLGSELLFPAGSP
jgi:hypothetical protein